MKLNRRFHPYLWLSTLTLGALACGGGGGGGGESYRQRFVERQRHLESRHAES
jgi:hypothetical protein